MFDPVSDGLDKNNNRLLALTWPIPLVSVTTTVQERVSCLLYQSGNVSMDMKLILYLSYIGWNGVNLDVSQNPSRLGKKNQGHYGAGVVSLLR